MPDHGDCLQEDLTDDGMERGSPNASERGSASTALSASHKPDIAVEQQILARVAFVCNPPPSKVSQDPLVRISLTLGTRAGPQLPRKCHEPQD